MATKNYNYQLIREKDDAVIFEGSYVKYFLEENYCAIFLQYPMERTTVKVCKRIPDKDTSYGYHKCRLVSRGINSPTVEIGKYVTVCDVTSEREAIEAVEANTKAESEIAALLQRLR